MCGTILMLLCEIAFFKDGKEGVSIFGKTDHYYSEHRVVLSE